MVTVAWSGLVARLATWPRRRATPDVVLDDCLERMRSQGARIEECRERWGQLGLQLEPLLLLARALWSLPRAEMPERRRRAALERIIGKE